NLSAFDPTIGEQGNLSLGGQPRVSNRLLRGGGNIGRRRHGGGNTHDGSSDQQGQAQHNRIASLHGTPPLESFGPRAHPSKFPENLDDGSILRCGYLETRKESSLLFFL